MALCFFWIDMVEVTEDMKRWTGALVKGLVGGDVVAISLMFGNL